MEKMVVEFGFVLFCLCFMFALLIKIPFAWGCLAGLAIMAFGAWFWDE